MLKRFLSIMSLLMVGLMIGACSSTQNLSSTKGTGKGMEVLFSDLWNYGKPEETREKFLALSKEKEGKADLNYILELKTQIARTYSLQAKFDEAHKELDWVESKLDEGTRTARVRYELERGRTFNSAGEKAKAMNFFTLAYENGVDFGLDNYAIDAAHMVAIASTNLENKVKWNSLGAELAEESHHENVKNWIGVFHNNIGWDLFEAKQYDKALIEFKKCWDFHEGRKNTRSLKIAKWSYAKTLRFLNQIDESLKIQLELLETFKGKKDPSGYGHEELGELFLIKGEIERSKEEFGIAFEILSQDVWLQRNEGARLNRIKELSK